MPGSAPSRSAAWSDGLAGADSPYDERPWVDSYPEGVPADFDFPSVPLTRLLDDAASSFPAGTALAFLGTRITYRELKDLVDRFAAALVGLGVTKGDRVAIVLPNCPQNVIAFFGALRLGAVVVQHNPLYTDAELRHQLADSGAKVVVCLDRVYDAVARVRADTVLEHVIVTSVLDYLPRSSRLKLSLPVAKARKAKAEISAPVPKGAPVTPFLALLRKATSPARQAPIEPETDLALLQYTGGTTGLSKGAMLTHGNLVSNAYMNRLWDTGATAGQEVTLGVLPLFHAYGLTVCMNATILLGGTLVLLPRFDLDQVFAAIDAWKPTMFPGVPPIYKALTDSPKAKSHDLRSIRVCVSGAMKLPGEVQEQFERISGARLVEGYGMTETSPSTHCNPLAGPRRAGSIGLPLPGTRCRIVDRDDPGREVPVGEPGELAIAGPQVFSGYWGRPDSDGVFTDDGYVLTGDIAVMDEDGYFTVVDRKKELIIAGGFNIYPSEVEEVLFRLPGVADAVVIGVPDRYRGETVKAYVVLQPGASLTQDDVVAHCAADLTAYKVPKIVEFRETLPRTAVGKVLRRVLVAEEQARAEQSAEPRPASVPGGIARRASEPGGFPSRDAEPATETPGARAAAAEDEVDTLDDAEDQAEGPAEDPAPVAAPAPAPRKRPTTSRTAAPRTQAGRSTQKKAGAPSRPQTSSGRTAAQPSPGLRAASPAKAGPTKPAPAKAGPTKPAPARAAAPKAAASGNDAAAQAAAPAKKAAGRAAQRKAAPAKSAPAKAPAKAAPAKVERTKAVPAKAAPPSTRPPSTVTVRPAPGVSAPVRRPGPSNNPPRSPRKSTGGGGR